MIKKCDDKKWIYYDNPKHKKLWMGPGQHRLQNATSIKIRFCCAFGGI